jgi:hypothetical protein
MVRHLLVGDVIGSRSAPDARRQMACLKKRHSGEKPAFNRHLSSFFHYSPPINMRKTESCLSEKFTKFYALLTGSAPQ